MKTSVEIKDKKERTCPNKVAIVNPPGWATGHCAGLQGNKEDLGYLNGGGWRATWPLNVTTHLKKSY
jgi:hypothetical protein